MAKKDAKNRDYIRVSWNQSAFFSEVSDDWSRASMAKHLGINGQTFYQWTSKGDMPFAVLKAIFETVFPDNPAATEIWESGVQLWRATHPVEVNERVLELARKYDSQRGGKTFTFKDGNGTLTIAEGIQPTATARVAHAPRITAVDFYPADSTPAPKAIPPAPEPTAPIASLEVSNEAQEVSIPTPFGDVVMRIPGRPNAIANETNEVLLNIAQRLLVERDTAQRQLIGLRSQLATEQSKVLDLQMQLTKAQDDLKVYEQLLETETGQQVNSIPLPKVSQAARDNVQQTLKERAPTLARYVESLPKTTAHSS